MGRITPAVVNEMQAVVGRDFVHQDPEVLMAYECDACVLIKSPPDLVVLPRTAEEAAEIVKICHREKIPFVARGGGTGLSGGALSLGGSIIIGLNRLDRILKIDPDNQTALIETGVVNAWLNREAKAYNLFYAPDPSSQAACTIGGNIAENAGGIHCIKYGVTADHILGLEVITPEGELVWIGGPHGLYKEVNWVGMFVGSEGTFGIVTKAIVRLMPIPQTTKVYLVSFDKLENATETVAAIIATGVQPAALEFMDDTTIHAVEQAFSIGFPENAVAVLLVELSGNEQDVQYDEEQLVKLTTTYYATQIRVAEDEKERLQLWKARKGAVAAYGRILPAFYLHDCVIPRSALTDMLKRIKAIGEKHQVIVANVFHAGDGNLHPNILLDPNDQDMVRRVLEAGDEILHACIEVGGVLSGEHGIGIEKSQYMPLLFTEEELEVMGRLKKVFNPSQLANPNKIFPIKSGCGESRKGGVHPLTQHKPMEAAR